MNQKNRLLIFILSTIPMLHTTVYTKPIIDQTEIIMQGKAIVDEYKKYNKVIPKNISSKDHHKEGLLEALFTNLEIPLESISYNFYDTLQDDIKNLTIIRKNLHTCNQKNPDIISMQHTIKFYISNIKQLLRICKKHKDFIQGYMILNFYHDLNDNKNEIVSWTCNKIKLMQKHQSFSDLWLGRPDYFMIYPLIAYTDTVNHDIEWIKKHNHSEYKKVMKKLKAIEKSMKASSMTLQTTQEYRLELQEKTKTLMQECMNHALNSISYNIMNAQYYA